MDTVDFREGDFVETVEHLIFAVKGLSHPHGRTIAYLRYVPQLTGERHRRDGMRFRRIYDLRESTNMLRRHYPQYTAHDSRLGSLLQSIPHEDLWKVYRPTECLKLITESPSAPLEKATGEFCDLVSERSGVALTHFGVSGSILLGLATDTSDIDIIVYGQQESLRVYDALPELRKQGQRLAPYDDVTISRIVQSRWGDTGIDLSRFLDLERSKLLHGMFDNREYFLRLVRDSPTPVESDAFFKPLGTAIVRGTVTEDSESVFTPCRYGINESRTLLGVPGPVTELFSYRGKFTEHVRKGQSFEARGKLENVKLDEESYMRIILGGPRDYLIPKERA